MRERGAKKGKGKEKDDAQIIVLSVEHRTCTIFIRTILYAQVSDKLCTIYLTRGEPVQVFLSIRSLQDMLPKEEFVMPDRSHLVAVRAIRTIADGVIVMSNSQTIPVSRRRSSTVARAFQACLSTDLRRKETASWKLNLAAEFDCMNLCPWPFFIVEASPDTGHSLRQFRFRYANDAFAAFAQISLTRLSRCTLQDVFPEQLPERLLLLTDTAFCGGSGSFWTRGPQGQTFSFFCYQPHYGLCACLLLPYTPPQYNLADKTETGGA